MFLRHLVFFIMVLFWCNYGKATSVELSGNYVRTGVSDAGTIGMGGFTYPGLQYDNTGTSTFNNSYDYLTPGNPFEGFTVKFTAGGSTLSFMNNNNAVSSRQIELISITNYSGTAYNGTTFDNRAVWEGSKSGYFGITHDYFFNDNQKFIDIKTTITPSVNMTNLYFGRYIDPDARAAAGDSSLTNNSLGYSTIPTTNVVMSEALVSKYALGLYSAASNVGAGISNVWTTDPVNYYNGINSGNGDYTIGLGFYVSSVNAGDIVTFQYAYIFGPTALSANQTAVDSGAGGGTPGEVPGCTSDCTITDPSSTPTLTGTSTTNTVTTSSYVNTSLPVVTGSIASHTSTETSKTQTINRTTTTTVTTPMVTQTNTTPVTTNTYSDGSTTSTTGSTTTTYSYYNSVSSSSVETNFTGQIDQYETLSNLNSGINKNLNHNNTNTKTIQTENGRAYINGNKSSQSLENGYSANTNSWGLGFEKDVNEDLTLGIQYNKIYSKLKGSDSNNTLDKDHIGLYSLKSFDGYTLQTDLGYSVNNYGVSRNVQNEFFNDSNTDGKDVWLRNRLFFPEVEGFRPFVGVNVEESTINKTTENGSIQSKRIIEKSKQNMDYSEAGLQYKKKIDKVNVFSEVSIATDNSKDLKIGLDYNYDREGKISLVASKQLQGEKYSSKGASLMVQYERKFWGSCGFGPWKNEKQGCKDLEKEEERYVKLQEDQLRKKEIYENMKKDPNIKIEKINF